MTQLQIINNVYFQHLLMQGEVFLMWLKEPLGSSKEKQRQTESPVGW